MPDPSNPQAKSPLHAASPSRTPDADAARDARDDENRSGPPMEPARPGFFSGLLEQVRKLGRDAASITVGRWLGEIPGEQPPNEPPAETTIERRRDPPQLAVLQRVADKLRGVADEYIAAKLDEIEARVDAKLDHIESRVDQKLQSLHEQFRVLRDQEVRHRLRLLNLTLAFAVLVAIISLIYKLVVRAFFTH